MLKKILCVVVAVMMLVALVACQPSNNEELDKLQQQMQELENKYANINELQQQAQKLKEEIASLNELLEALQSENSSLAGQTQDALEQIEQLQEDINQKQKTIDELENMLSDVVVERVDYYHRASSDGGSCEGDPGPNIDIACGYRFLQVSYNRNNVEIRFYVGQNSSYYDEDRDDEDVRNYVEISLISGYYANDDNRPKYHDNKTVVSRINNFYKSKYGRRADLVANVSEFNYSEKIIIPQELFVDEEGFIIFSANVYFRNKNNEYSRGEGTFFRIRYRAIGEDIILYPDIF